MQDGLANYEQASISYDISRNCGTLLNSDATASVNDTGISQVAYLNDQDPAVMTEASAPPCTRCIWKTAQLSIQYPHPDSMLGMAQATLRLSAQAPALEPNADPALQFAGPKPRACPVSRNFCNDELWVMDLPKAELDQLLTTLSGEGFFDDSALASAGPHLDVSINRMHTAKTWSRTPRLDQFVSRVYAEGRLRGFLSCQQACKSPRATPRFPESPQRS